MLTRLLIVIMIILMAVSAAAQDMPPVTEFEIGQPITAISTYSDQTVDTRRRRHDPLVFRRAANPLPIVRQWRT